MFAVRSHHRRSRRRSEGSDALLRVITPVFYTRFFAIAPLDLHKGKKYGWNVYFCCIKETGQPALEALYILFWTLRLTVRSHIENFIPRLLREMAQGCCS